MITHAKGEVWDTQSRKGALTIQLEDDVDMSVDDFFEATIIQGRARYLSNGNRLEQKAFGLGTRGDTISFRTTLTSFLHRRDDIEKTIEETRAQWRAAQSAKKD